MIPMDAFKKAVENVKTGGGMMKRDIIIIALISILFILVAGSILASFTFYKEYKDKIDYLEQQTNSDKTKMEEIDAKVEGFKMNIDEMTNQVKAFGDNLNSVQNTLNLSSEERKSFLAKIEEMKNELQNWQKDYSSTVIDIKQSMLTLKDDFDKIQRKSNIELGKITVKQEEKTVAAAPTAVEPAQSASGSSNFKSGNVRKVGGY